MRIISIKQRRFSIRAIGIASVPQALGIYAASAWERFLHGILDRITGRGQVPHQLVEPQLAQAF